MRRRSRVTHKYDMRRQRARAICALARRAGLVEERERVEVEHESCACERFDGEEPWKGDGGHCIVAFAEVKACVDAERHCGSGKFQVGGKERIEGSNRR